MHLVRLVYYSESRLLGTGGTLLAGLKALQQACARNNARIGLTGALAFDDLWFLQALEGERTAVWRTFRSILDDARHDDVVLVASTPITSRLFGDWAMRLVLPTGEGAKVMAPFKRDGVLRPERMTGDDIVAALGALVLAERSPASRASEA